MLPIHLYLTIILAISVEVKSNGCEINGIKDSNCTSDYIDQDLDLSYLSTNRFIPVTFPGTKWCGPGNIAYNYDDLGLIYRTDVCCRKHDNCDEVIPPGKTKYGLTNHALHSRLSCRCDEEFRKCLNDIGSPASTLVGNTYFNVIGTRCFKKTYRKRDCLKAGGYLNTKCVKYGYDKTSEKVYQWFDVPNYRPVRIFIADITVPLN